MNEQGIYISEKVKDSSGIVINPATKENQDEAITALNLINQKKIGDSFWLKNVLSAITRLTVDASGQLRAVVSGTVNVGTITTLTTLTTWNIGIWDSGKVATMISQSNANFQGGWRRLIRKV